MTGLLLKFSKVFYFGIYSFLFIWLHWVLVVALGIFNLRCRIFGCGMWDLVPDQGSNSAPPALGAWSLSYCTTKEVPEVT